MHDDDSSSSSSAAVLDEEPLSVFQLIGPSSSTCGYCSHPGARSATKSSKSYGVWAHQLSCAQYKALIDRGWRRSGLYIYKPNMRDTCCPQYTIRLDAKAFKPSKGQRSIINRFNAFIREGGKEGQPGWGPPSDPADTDRPPAAKDVKGKGKAQQTFDLAESLHAVESVKDTKHSFSVELVPAECTSERYELYKKYQMEIHKDKESKLSEQGFKRFLCDSPLRMERSPCKKQPYGTFHQLYRIDGRLVTIGVLDLLPGAVSGVYFIYDPAYSALSLGKLSALRECSLAAELEAQGWPKMHYMMGYYIHTCQKMRYKAEYAPSELLDPETFDWYPFAEVCKPILDKHQHASFARAASLRGDESSDTNGHNVSGATGKTKGESGGESGSSSEDSEADSDEEMPAELPPGFLDPGKIPLDLLISIYILEKGQVIPLGASRAWRRDAASQKKLREGISALGEAARGTCLCI